MHCCADMFIVARSICVYYQVVAWLYCSRCWWTFAVLSLSTISMAAARVHHVGQMYRLISSNPGCMYCWYCLIRFQYLITMGAFHSWLLQLSIDELDVCCQSCHRSKDFAFKAPLWGVVEIITLWVYIYIRKQFVRVLNDILGVWYIEMALRYWCNHSSRD